MNKNKNFILRFAKLFILSLALMLVLPACGSNKKEANNKSNDTKKVVTQKATSTPIPKREMVKDVNGNEWPKDFSLYKTYKDDFLFGTVYAFENLSGLDYEVSIQNFNSITPGNLMKPENMQPTEGNFKYIQADTMLAFAKKNNLTVNGHTLVWHNQSGNWLGINVTREKAIEQLKSHITTIVGHYKGRLYSWDVVNEAINDGVTLPADGDWTKCLRQTQWYNSIGPDYIAMAFKFAREADPNLKLYYNDYNLDYKDKADIVYAMVKDLKAQGVPIDGIGMQGHYNMDTKIDNVEYSLKRFSELNVLVSVSELDITVKNVAATGLTKDQEIKQGILYAKLFQLYKKYNKLIERVTVWGFVDSKSWRRDSYPCLFNADYTPKLAAYAVLDPDKFLKLYQNNEEKKEVNRAKALSGTPKIDGEIDKIWDKCPITQINNPVMAWQGATGTVRLLWDKSFVYALFEIKDSELNSSSPNEYEQDSIEVFLDQENNKNSTYDDNDGQYRVNFKGKESFGTIPAVKGFLSAAKQKDGGYLIEVAIPLLGTAEKGKVMGFDVQINDSNSLGKRQSIMKFNDSTDNSYQSTENWGEVELD